MHVPTLLVVAFLAMSRGEGGRDGTGFQCWTTRPKTSISVTQSDPSVCKSAIASATTDREDDLSKGRQLAVTRAKTLKWKVSENGDRVFAVSVEKESRSNSTECYLVNSTSLKIGKGKTKPIRCKCDHFFKDPKGLITVVPMNSLVNAVGGIMSHKLAPPPEQKATTPTPVGCYNWRPNIITLILVNQTIKVTWSPPFKEGSLEIYLFDIGNEHKIVTRHIFRSYDIYEHDITDYTFRDVKYGNYEARIKPICSNCPERETGGCHVDPISSDPIQVFPPRTEDPIEYAVTRPSIATTIRDNMAAFYFMVAVTTIAVISAVVMGVMCLKKDSLPCANRLRKNTKQSKPSVPFGVVYTQLGTAETGTDGGTPRVVILYGVDHDFHIQAVRAFARLLRTLLNAEVVVEREQSRHDLCNISDWVTTNLEPPTVVIVVASEGLYQLFGHHNGQQGVCVSKLQSDMFADYSSKALGYLRERNFTTTRSQMVLPVSFGYEHGNDSLNKLMDSCRLLFKGVYFKITETTATGQRHLYMDELLQCLARNQTIHVPNYMPEAQEFLHYVDAMNDHIRTFGSTCWKYDPSVRSDDQQTIYSRASSTEKYTVIGDAFSIGSGVSGTSNVTVNFTCKNCLTSSWLTLPQSAVGSVSDRGIRSSRQSTISESSCVSEPFSESRDDVFYSESEIGPETRGAVFDSGMESSPLSEASFNEPVHSEQTEIGGRDC
ncbi:uncharacterized protein LOC124270191 [Haliotis rubra]|uniref:uncharacterized protein LOC124270191 n=1 Tax=Haliotis rubra TaxID=36100 RepID=UPI001EE5BB9F|nr:uncharacterized protein LOC124270191 [Haliotis rubra]